MYRAFLVRVDGRQDPVAVLGGAIRDFVRREDGRVRVEYFQAHPEIEIPEWVEAQLRVRRAPVLEGAMREGEIRVVGELDER